MDAATIAPAATASEASARGGAEAQLSGETPSPRPRSRAGALAAALGRYRLDALCLATALLPVLASATWKAFLRPRPFWAFFYDPESFYFHDGLRLLAGRMPLDVTHPGTPVQALSALLSLTTGATAATPEAFDRFRAAAYCAAWGLQVLGAVALLRTVLARVPVPLRIAALATYFVAARSLAYETVWSPEILYFPAGALALAALWWALQRDFDFRSSVGAGATVGLACAVKFLFLPWLFAAALTAFVSGGRRTGRVRAATGTLLGAALAFLAATSPAAGRWPDMLSWVARLASRSGQYGDSPRALPSFSTLLGNLWTLLAAAKGWYLWLLLAAAGAWLAIRHTGDADLGRDEERRRLRALAFFAATAIALGHLLVLRGPSAHYLLPAAMAGVGLVAVAAHAPELRRHTWLRWAGLLLVAALLGKHVEGDVRTHLARNEMAEHARTAITTAVARHAPSTRSPVVVYGYSTPMPSLALRYFATDPRLLRRVELLFPGEGHLGPKDRLVLPTGTRDWDVMVLAARDRQRVAASLGAIVVDQASSWEVLVPAHRTAPAAGNR